jgi:hypothetical protein
MTHMYTYDLSPLLLIKIEGALSLRYVPGPKKFIRLFSVRHKLRLKKQLNIEHDQL